MALVWLLLARFGCFSLTRIRSCGLSDHSVEGIRKHALWAPVEAVDVVEVARLFKVAFDEPHVAAVIQLVPDGDRLRGKTAVRERDYRRTAYPQDAPDLSQYLDRPGQVVDGYTDRDAVELCVPEPQSGVSVQVLDDVGVEPLVTAEAPPRSYRAQSPAGTRSPAAGGLRSCS